MVKYLSEAELKKAAHKITGRKLAKLGLQKIEHLMTITQFVTDTCINELERRGALEYFGGNVCIPYLSSHGVDTILSRPLREKDSGGQI